MILFSGDKHVKLHHLNPGQNERFENGNNKGSLGIWTLQCQHQRLLKVAEQCRDRNLT